MYIEIMILIYIDPAIIVCTQKSTEIAVDVENAPRTRRLASASVKLKHLYTFEFGSADPIKHKRTTRKKKVDPSMPSFDLQLGLTQETQEFSENSNDDE